MYKALIFVFVFSIIFASSAIGQIVILNDEDYGISLGGGFMPEYKIGFGGGSIIVNGKHEINCLAVGKSDDKSIKSENTIHFGVSTRLREQKETDYLPFNFILHVGYSSTDDREFIDLAIKFAYIRYTERNVYIVPSITYALNIDTEATHIDSDINSAIYRGSFDLDFYIRSKGGAIFNLNAGLVLPEQDLTTRVGFGITFPF